MKWPDRQTGWQAIDQWSCAYGSSPFLFLTHRLSEDIFVNIHNPREEPDIELSITDSSQHVGAIIPCHARHHTTQPNDSPRCCVLSDTSEIYILILVYKRELTMSWWSTLIKSDLRDLHLKDRKSVSCKSIDMACMWLTHHRMWEWLAVSKRFTRCCVKHVNNCNVVGNTQICLLTGSADKEIIMK